jgi:hypothetical protein
VLAESAMSGVAARNKSPEQRENERMEKVMDRLHAVMDEAAAIEIPPPVVEITRIHTGNPPKLSVEALELARVVYYERFGSFTDCARAIIDSGLTEDDTNVDQIRDRVRNWFSREEWPRRPQHVDFALRDAQHGGLYRGAGAACVAVTTGKGAIRAGVPCGGSPLPDSEFCFAHDPRPEYVERRRQQTEKLLAARLGDSVPAAPFREWLKAQLPIKLREARERGENIHWNDEGYKWLAEWLGLSLQVLHKAVHGYQRSGYDPTRDDTIIKASTVVKYLENVDVTFRDIYGYDPPPAHQVVYDVCPECGGRKNNESKMCRTCHDSQGVVCGYTTRYGKVCQLRTKHPSGWCMKHREQLERAANAKPRSEYNYKKGALEGTPTMLFFALDEYRRYEERAWAANRMWACNAGGCRDAYKRRNTLAGEITKLLRKRYPAPSSPTSWVRPSGRSSTGRSRPSSCPRGRCDGSSQPSTRRTSRSTATARAATRRSPP